MKTEKLISAFLGAVVIAMSMSVSAFNDGHLDGVWFKTQIRTTVKPYHSLWIAGPISGPFSLNRREIKFDSGKDSCYSTLIWGGDVTFYYNLYNFCQRFGKWEFISIVGLNELPDGGDGSVGSSNLSGSSISLSGVTNFKRNQFIILPAKGTSINDTEPKVAMYEGTFILKPIRDKAGNIKVVKLVYPQDGTILYSDFKPFNDGSGGGEGYTGTGPSGLSMKQVNPRWIPKGAKACLDSVLGVGPAIQNCALAPVTP
jgi:hypothetical protein